jgi:hypothetical protein
MILQAMEDLTEQYTNIIGDVLLSAAVVAYLGPFILDFRQVCQSIFIQTGTALYDLMYNLIR